MLPPDLPTLIFWAFTIVFIAAIVVLRDTICTLGLALRLRIVSRILKGDPDGYLELARDVLRKHLKVTPPNKRGR